MGKFEDKLVAAGFVVKKMLPKGAGKINDYKALSEVDFAETAKVLGRKVIYHEDMMDIWTAISGTVDRELFYFPDDGLTIGVIVENE
jgi:hypothetical protein